MPVVVYRQPWFWAVVIAVVALLTFGIVIAASGPNRDANDTTTVIQQPSPQPETAVVPVPTPGLGGTGSAGSTTAPTPAPARPEEPERPVRPATPPPTARPEPPQVIRERTVIIREGNRDKEPAANKPGTGSTTPPLTPPPAPSDPDAGTDSSAMPGGSGRVLAQDVFQRTGLPKEISFDTTRWQATRVVTVTPDKRLTEAGTTEDGQSVMVSENAVAPFQTVLIATPDDPERYVEYRRK